MYRRPWRLGHIWWRKRETMTFHIPRGKHRAWPWRFWLWWHRTSFDWVVKFDESCRYDLQNVDQLDTNKLCGIGYLPGHHKDSARFGWRYDTATGQVALSTYCYDSGRRMAIQHICWCEIDHEYYIDLKILSQWYKFTAYKKEDGVFMGSVEVQYFHDKKFKYRLGTYFGGNQKAPHEIKIQLTKV